jgi:hypothetical protein
MVKRALYAGQFCFEQNGAFCKNPKFGNQHLGIQDFRKTGAEPLSYPANTSPKSGSKKFASFGLSSANLRRACGSKPILRSTGNLPLSGIQE